jgi:hypothetical protein
LFLLEDGQFHPSLKQEIGKLLWRSSPRTPTRVEQQRMAGRERLFSDIRAGLLSDFLRRHRLLVELRRVGAHWVDLYDHWRRDIVVEWCCGPDVSTVARDMVDAGLCVQRLDQAHGWEFPDSWTQADWSSFLPREGPIRLRRLECDGHQDCTTTAARAEADLLTTSQPVLPRQKV